MTQSSHHAEPHAHHLGVWAEQAALTLLQAHGFQLVQQNFRSRRGEIDLIVAKGDELVLLKSKHAPKGVMRWQTKYSCIHNNVKSLRRHSIF